MKSVGYPKRCRASLSTALQIMTTQIEHPSSFFGEAFGRVRRRIELGDALIFLYAVVLARQYFWIIENNLIAWTLTVALAVVCWYFYLATKQFPAENFGRSFWLLVGLPLLGFYLLRAAFPDHSYDVFSYHLLHAERSLRGALYAPGDYFPTALPFNPVADTLTGLDRKSTRLNSSHSQISYAVFCLKKKKAK